MFSTMTNQMSTWLGGLSKKPADGTEPLSGECNDLDKDQDSKTNTPTSQKSVKGSLDEQDNGSSTTEGADSNISSPARSPSDENHPNKVSEKLNQGAKSFGSFLSSALNKAGKTVSEAGTKIKKSVADTSVLADFYKENEAFASAVRKHGPAPPPWAGCDNEELLKEQISSLSTDRKNFVRCPPAEAEFEFDMESFMPVAAAVLKDDVDLQKMRYMLVPKTIKEEVFWRNYFYRVSLIKKAAETGASLTQDSSRTSSMDAVVDADLDDDLARPESPEFVSDDIKPSSRDLEEVRAGVRQLGVNAKDDDWERELTAELAEYELVPSATAAVNGSATVNGSAAVNGSATVNGSAATATVGGLNPQEISRDPSMQDLK